MANIVLGHPTCSLQLIQARAPCESGLWAPNPALQVRHLAKQCTCPEIHDLAFIEELWQYTPPTQDALQDEYGCTLLYRTSPMATFYVIRADEILGPAAICRNTAPPRIPTAGLGKVAERRRDNLVNPCAQADKGPDDTSGSELYRLNIWHMMGGSMIAVQPLAYCLDRPVTRKRSDRTLRTPGRCLLPY